MWTCQCKIKFSFSLAVHADVFGGSSVASDTYMVDWAKLTALHVHVLLELIEKRRRILRLERVPRVLEDDRLGRQVELRCLL